MLLHVVLSPLFACIAPAAPDGPGSRADSGGTTTDSGTADSGGADAGGGDSGTADSGGGDGGSSVTLGTRGVWAWRDEGDPHGTDAVVGDAALEAAAIQTLIDWGVDRVYGSYGDRAQTEPDVIASWNLQLHAAGIESHVLMGDPAWVSSREWSNMLSKVDSRLIAFNDSRTVDAERFDGLHLDIEPQGADDWSDLSDTDRYWRLFLLDETYAEARGAMDAGSGVALPIGADLPVWFDNLPSTLGGDGSIGWESEAARDAWFTGLGASLSSISLMAYERETDALIIDAVATEASLFPGEVRVGLNEEVGTTWPDIAALFTMAGTLEGAGYVVDLHAYGPIRTLTGP